MLRKVIYSLDALAVLAMAWARASSPSRQLPPRKARSSGSSLPARKRAFVFPGLGSVPDRLEDPDKLLPELRL